MPFLLYSPYLAAISFIYTKAKNNALTSALDNVYPFVTPIYRERRKAYGWS